MTARRVAPLLALTLLGATRQELDEAPLPRYLGAEDVHAVILAALPELGDCYAHSSARGRVLVDEVHVVFSVLPDGGVAGVSTRSGSGLPDLDACLVEGVGALRFPPHDEEPMEVGYPFVFRDAALQPYPMVFVRQRDIAPVFLHLPSDPAAARRLLDALEAPRTP